MKNFFNTKVKDMNAITLIALVITIIILLILAGVTIGVATNGTGLFEKAKLATDEYNNKVQQEETELAKASNEIDSYIGNSRNGIEIVESGANNDNTSFYIKYSNGLLYQWGVLSNTTSISNNNGTNTDITFIKSFSNINYSLSLTKYTDSSSYGNVASIDLRIEEKQNSKAIIRVYNNSNASSSVGKIDWIAIGY